MTADLLFDLQHQAGPAQDPSTIAELSLARLTDDVTYQRATQYANDLAVIELVNPAGTSQIVGRVRGSRGQTYACAARFTQKSSGMVTSFSGACSCPVGSNCKHIFALAITAFRHRRAIGAAPDRSASAEGRRALRSSTAGDALTEVSRQQPSSARSAAPMLPPSTALLPAAPAPWKRSLSALIRDDRAVAPDAPGG